MATQSWGIESFHNCPGENRTILLSCGANRGTELITLVGFPQYVWEEVMVFRSFANSRPSSAVGGQRATSHLYKHTSCSVLAANKAQLCWAGLTQIRMDGCVTKPTLEEGGGFWFRALQGLVQKQTVTSFDNRIAGGC